MQNRSSTDQFADPGLSVIDFSAPASDPSGSAVDFSAGPTADPSLSVIDFGHSPAEATVQTDNSYVGNIVRGAGERAVNVGGGLVRFVGQTADDLADWLEEYIPLGQPWIDENGISIRPMSREDMEAESPLISVARDLESADLGVDQSQLTSWEQVKDQPLSSILPFALEQGLISAPDMAAVVFQLPAYVAARTGEIGQARAENDGRADATMEDFVKAAPASIGSAFLERLGARGMFGLDDIAVQSFKEIPKEVGKAGVKEGATEFGQEVLESTAETAGTERGFDLAETLERGAQGAVAGGPFGAGVRAGSAGVEASRYKSRSSDQVLADAIPAEEVIGTEAPEEAPPAAAQQPMGPETPEHVTEPPRARPGDIPEGWGQYDVSGPNGQPLNAWVSPDFATVRISQEPIQRLEVPKRMAPLTPEDEASALPDDLISRGKAVIDDAAAGRPLDVDRPAPEMPEGVGQVPISTPTTPLQPETAPVDQKPGEAPSVAMPDEVSAEPVAALQVDRVAEDPFSDTVSAGTAPAITAGQWVDINDEDGGHAGTVLLLGIEGEQARVRWTSDQNPLGQIVSLDRLSPERMSYATDAKRSLGARLLEQYRAAQPLSLTAQTTQTPVPEAKVSDSDTKFQPAPITPDIRRDIGNARSAVDNLIRARSGSVPDVLVRKDFGAVTIDWGKEGNPARNYAGGYGLAKIIAKRSEVDGIDGEAYVRERLPEILARGDLDRIYGPPNSRRADIVMGKDRVVLSLSRLGNRETWILTGFEERSDGGSGFVPATRLRSTPSRYYGNEGADADNIGEPSGSLKSSDVSAKDGDDKFLLAGGGDLSFSHDGARYVWTPKLAEQANELRGHLKKLVAGINPNANLLVVDRIESPQGPALGASTDVPGIGRAILVAMRYRDADGQDRANPNPVITLNHEVMHDLRKQGLFTEQEERQIFIGKVNRRWQQRFGADGRYERYKDKGVRAEEAAADAYAAHRAGEFKATGAIKAAFDKITRFFRRFANWLRRNGFQAAEDVFRRIDSGEVGRRTPKPKSTDTDAKFSLISTPDGDPRATAEGGAVARQSMMVRMLGAQPLDRIMRMPFDFFGGVNAQNEWEPGRWMTKQAKRAITEAKFDDEGSMSWLNPTLKAVRAGMIDRYGLDAEYVDRDLKRSLDERKIMAEVPELMKTLKGADIGPAEAKVLQAVLTGEAVPDADMAKVSEPIRNAIDALGQEAVELGLLSAESYERNKGSYLHRVYLKHETDRDGFTRWVNRLAGSRRKKVVGDQFKGRGMFLELTDSKLGGPAEEGKQFNVYDKIEDDKIVSRKVVPVGAASPGQDYTSKGMWQVRAKRNGKTVLWRDFTKAERLSMGEVVDARYTIAKTYMGMAHDLATGRFYRDIAANPEWTTETEPLKGTWTRSGDPSWRKTYTATDWILVPDTKIGDSDTSRYGALSGKYVRSEIWRDIQDLDRMQKSGFWSGLLREWKKNKTSRNPVVHMNNVMSNFTLMDLADVRMIDLAKGVRSMVKKDADYRAAVDAGAFGSDMMSVEIRQNVLEPALKEIEREMQGGMDTMETRIGALGMMADVLWRKAKWLDQKMVDVYQLEDEVFRMATYMRKREMGMSPDLAAKEAREQFLNYDIRAPWVNAARRSVLPFLSYTYRAIPVLAKSIAYRPWKLAKYYLVAHAMKALTYELLGDEGDEDREQRSLRDEEQGIVWMTGLPRMARLPMNDEHGNAMFLDIRRWMPLGDLFDMNQGSSAIPVPAPFQFGGPLMIAAEVWLNKVGFTGREIRSDYDTAGEITSKTSDYLWKAWMPSAPWIPKSWYWTKIGNALKGARDWQGRPYSVPQALASSVGIKIKPQDVEEGMYFHGREFDKVERELNFSAGRVSRDLSRGLIDQGQYDSRMARLYEKLDHLTQRRRKLLGDDEE